MRYNIVVEDTEKGPSLTVVGINNGVLDHQPDSVATLVVANLLWRARPVLAANGLHIHPDSLNGMLKCQRPF